MSQISEMRRTFDDIEAFQSKVQAWWDVGAALRKEREVLRNLGKAAGLRVSTLDEELPDLPEAPTPAAVADPVPGPARIYEQGHELPRNSQYEQGREVPVIGAGQGESDLTRAA